MHASSTTDCFFVLCCTVPQSTLVQYYFKSSTSGSNYKHTVMWSTLPDSPLMPAYLQLIGNNVHLSWHCVVLVSRKGGGSSGYLTVCCAWVISVVKKKGDRKTPQDILKVNFICDKSCVMLILILVFRLQVTHGPEGMVVQWPLLASSKYLSQKCLFYCSIYWITIVHAGVSKGWNKNLLRCFN